VIFEGSIQHFAMGIAFRRGPGRTLPGLNAEW
jgi:hypothetical protein